MQSTTTSHELVHFGTGVDQLPCILFAKSIPFLMLEADRFRITIQG